MGVEIKSRSKYLRIIHFGKHAVTTSILTAIKPSFLKYQRLDLGISNPPKFNSERTLKSYLPVEGRISSSKNHFAVGDNWDIGVISVKISVFLG